MSVDLYTDLEGVVGIDGYISWVEGQGFPDVGGTSREVLDWYVKVIVF